MITVLENEFKTSFTESSIGKKQTDPVPLKSLKKGDYFTLKDIPEPKESQVWVKDEYDKSSRKFICLKFTDYLGNGKEMDGNKMVYTDFIF